MSLLYWHPRRAGGHTTNQTSHAPGSLGSAILAFPGRLAGSHDSPERNPWPVGVSAILKLLRTRGGIADFGRKAASLQAGLRNRTTPEHILVRGPRGLKKDSAVSLSIGHAGQALERRTQRLRQRRRSCK